MVPFLDLQVQVQSLREEIDAALARVLDSCRFALGPEVEAFESEFADYTMARHGIAVNSGTSALHLSLLALGVGVGDEVITVAMTFVATVQAIRYTGATPVLVDIDRETYTLDPQKLELAITPRTRAIVPVHLYGQSADMGSILGIARKHNIAVLEDACQAHGGRYKEQAVGSLGDLGCFSFYPGKNLGACGEGGIVVTDDDELAAKIRSFRDWGQSKKYHHDLQGFNYRMDAFQGAILRVKLRHLEAWTEARRGNARLYDEALKGFEIQLPRERDGSRHVYHIYAISSPNRDSLQEHLKDRDIHTGLHYPIPVHLLGAHVDLGYKNGDFPVSERLAREELSLPMYAELGEDHITDVTAAIGCWRGSD
jgi:dTDP-4-amino-4,6-dideoxygalactose transaminase